MVRGSMRLLGRYSSTLASIWAETLFRMPPRQPKTRSELALLGGARRERATYGKRRLAVWRGGGDGPTVLLVHGWGGHAARLSQFVAPLRAAGFSVMSFDGPAHGESEGFRASVPEFADAIEALQRIYGGFQGAVAHSLGAMACMLALRRGLALPRAVFLAPAADPERYAKKFARFFGISPHIRESMETRFQERYQIRWQDLRIAEWVARCPTRLLVFHDRRDACVPICDGASIVKAWRGARLVPTGGLGHHRILQDPAVISRAVAFLEAGSAVACLGDQQEAS
jgi:pimeloyl-ACP methyl ester carboxylesterase